MPTTYTPNPANNPSAITLPSDGDQMMVASVNTPFEGLADKIAYTQANYATEAARVADVNQLALQIPGCRLTTFHADAYTRVPFSDLTSIGSIGLNVFEHNRISLWDGSKWVSRTIEPIATNALTLSGLTTGKNYDVFAYWTGTAVRLELSAAWTDDTTRADALVVNPASANWKGLITKDADPTRLYVGTIRATSATTTADTKTKRFLWSMYHRARRALVRRESATSWTMAAGVYRQANANAANQVEFVAGFGDCTVEAQLRAMAQISGSNRDVEVAFGFDSTTTEAADQVLGGFASQGTATADEIWSIGAAYRGQPVAGYHRLVWLERCSNATASFYGGSSTVQSGIVGTIDG